MKKEGSDEHINIRPGVSILSVLSHLNYKPWFAIAEFVDNSLQSYLDCQAELEEAEGIGYKLQVSIELDNFNNGHIVIRDNAGGIHKGNFSRAFRAAEVPPNRNGLSEFGMGMKSAACYFSRQWSVRTSVIGEDVERKVEFDIDQITQSNIEEIRIATAPANSHDHFTEIELFNVTKYPQKKTLGKIKEHLASIYRIFIRKGLLKLIFNGEELTYESPKILIAPMFSTKNEPIGEPIEWKKSIKIDFGLNYEITGFVALREVASTSSAGFALFRRDRLIEGSSDDSYRPEEIFGSNNSFVYQRLFGELHVNGFQVSHTKDGFQWDENEVIMLEFLLEQLNAEPTSLLSQARNYRVSPKSVEMKAGAKVAVERTAEIVKSETPQILGQQVRSEPEYSLPPYELPKTSLASLEEIEIDVENTHWKIIIELSDDPAISYWIDICDHLIPTLITDNNTRYLGIRLSLAHPFMLSFAGPDSSKIEPVLRIAVALALAETTARDGGMKYAGTIRRNVNELLRDALSKVK